MKDATSILHSVCHEEYTFMGNKHNANKAMLNPEMASHCVHSCPALPCSHASAQQKRVSMLLDTTHSTTAVKARGATLASAATRLLALDRLRHVAGGDLLRIPIPENTLCP